MTKYYYICKFKNLEPVKSFSCCISFIQDLTNEGKLHKFFWHCQTRSHSSRVATCVNYVRIWLNWIIPVHLNLFDCPGFQLRSFFSGASTKLRFVFVDHFHSNPWCVWEAEPWLARDEWRCWRTVSGGPCVMTTGTFEQPPWCVESLGSAAPKRPWWTPDWDKVQINHSIK